MPAVSKAQREAMAIAENNPAELNPENHGLLNMSHAQLHDFSATPEKGLPRYASPRKPKRKEELSRG